jgi:hypothetical protein
LTISAVVLCAEDTVPASPESVGQDGDGLVDQRQGAFGTTADGIGLAIVDQILYPDGGEGFE